MNKLRLLIDVLMLVIMPLLMPYALIGESIHEAAGIVMLILVIIHNILNRKWWMNLLKGKYTPSRALSTFINIALIISLLLQPISGILMSKHYLTLITLKSQYASLRSIHMLLAYWSFVLMSLHLGLHAKMFINKIKPPQQLKYVVYLLSIYGIYAFIKRQIGQYMLMKILFVFFDYGENPLFFIFDYLTVMILFATISYYLQVLLKSMHKKSA